MKNLADFLDEDFAVTLEGVSYVAMAEPANGKLYSVKVRDTTECHKEDKGIALKIMREVELDPNPPFKICVSYMVKYRLKKEYIDSKEWENVDIDEIMKNGIEKGNIEGLVIDCMDNISLLISQITNTFAERPVMTPPSLVQSI